MTKSSIRPDDNRQTIRRQFRLLNAKLANLFSGGSRGGYFIPYRYSHALSAPRYPIVEQQYRDAEDRFLEILSWIGSHAAELNSFQGPAPQPRWHQDWFTGLDGAAAYAIVRKIRPRRIVEVGSGHSTRFLARACEDGALPCHHICVDPKPRASLAGLRVDWRAELLNRCHRELTESLDGDDILFIDSSHVAMPGTDVELLFGDFLGALKAGVWVHVHDIFLPDNYPEQWVWRGYNEQTIIASLIAARAIKTQFSSHYVRTRLDKSIGAQGVDALVSSPQAPETSLWFTMRD